MVIVVRLSNKKCEQDERKFWMCMDLIEDELREIFMTSSKVNMNILIDREKKIVAR